MTKVLTLNKGMQRPIWKALGLHLRAGARRRLGAFEDGYKGRCVELPLSVSIWSLTAKCQNGNRLNSWLERNLRLSKLFSEDTRGVHNMMKNDVSLNKALPSWQGDQSTGHSNFWFVHEFPFGIIIHIRLITRLISCKGMCLLEATKPELSKGKQNCRLKGHLLSEVLLELWTWVASCIIQVVSSSSETWVQHESDLWPFVSLPCNKCNRGSEERAVNEGDGGTVVFSPGDTAADDFFSVLPGS